jgi:hypothetical protein
MIWVPYSAAVHEAERQLGIPLIKAHEALSAAVENNEVTSRRDEENDLFVLDTSVLDWIKRRQSRGGKQPRIRKLLAQRFPNCEVPEPKLCPRLPLRAELVKADPSLDPLNLSTLKTAIDDHNAAIRNDPNRTVSN